MTRVALAAVLACGLQPRMAHSQALAGEATMSTGYSTQQDTSTAAAQVRLLGEVTPAVRFFLEGAWAATSESDVDAFGAAYPYGNRLQVIEAYADWMVRSGDGLMALKAGRYRTPFGISSGSDHGYGGFLRAPLMRYDGYHALSNNFLEHGASVMAGVPRLTVEASIGVPADVGLVRRRSALNAVVRVQHYAGPLIVGASYIDTAPYLPRHVASGRMRFGGFDFRWMQSGLQVRGELLAGQPFNGTTTTGWYADVFLHRARMGPVTAMARVERLAYVATAPFDVYANRQTLGARIRLMNGLTLQANVVRQSGVRQAPAQTALDAGLTYSVRRD